MGRHSTAVTALQVSQPGRPQGNERARMTRRRHGGMPAIVAAAIFALAAASASGAGSVAGGRAGVIRPWDALYSVAFLPSGKCYVVGAEGVLLTSTDGGRSWTRGKLAELGDLSWSDLYSIRFASDGRTGWVSGEGGLILRTTDGGDSWHPQPSGTTENLFRLAVVDSETAYATGTDGVLMSTADGGAHWRNQIFKGDFTFFDIAFAGARDGWAVGEFETIIHTSDGGKTWAAQIGGKRANYKLPALFAVRFADPRHGWAAGQGGAMLRTEDGGKAWQPFKTPSEAPMYVVDYAGGAAGGAPTELWGAGDGGTLLRVALGAGVAAEQRPTFFSLADIAFHGATGIAVGISGTILRTSDGGAHWQVVTGK